MAILHPRQNYEDGSLSWGMSKMYSTLPEYLARLRSFKVVLGMWQSFPSAELHGLIPNLERLDIAARHTYDRSIPLTGFQDAPRLREVCLSGLTFRDISLPWTQVMHLELGDGFEPALQILEQTTQLAVLIIEFPESMQADRDDEPDIIRPPLTLHHLHTMRLSDITESRIL
ncbi:hypothetical protein B0H12DRAFT_1232176 [Mycena haematopus]|nr:hypothetical protein B0H12DRAFT_1232176 [Mycena haematopus]